MQILNHILFEPAGEIDIQYISTSGPNKTNFDATQNRLYVSCENEICVFNVTNHPL